MLKVLLVDDDFLVRMYLRQLIDWEAEGCVLVADACNGEEAAELIEREQPQIIITDLNMPVMDGITLIRQLKEQGNPARIAVLSCHEEFEFVREAMKLGADEYVLKNTLDAKGLRTLLADLRRGMAASQEEARQSEQLHWLAQKGNEALQQDALRRLRREEMPYAQQTEFLRSHGISGDYYQCGAVEIAIGRAEQMPVAFRVCAQCIRGKNAVCVVLEEKILAVILGLPGVSSAQERHSALFQLSATLQKEILEYADDKPGVGFSQVLWGDGNVTRAMRQAAEAALHLFYGESLCDYGRLPPITDQLPPAVKRVGQTAEHYAADLAEEVLAACRTACVRPALVQAWLAALHKQLMANQPLPENPKNFEECRQRLNLYREAWEISARDQTHRTDNLAVGNAAAYIRAHFAEPLPLNQVAEAVQLNPAYLSHLFKRETGIGFSEYLQNCRMNYVRRQLAETEESIKAIAASAGFTDYQNFCKLFKKQSGLRPADFRRQSKKSGEI